MTPKTMVTALTEAETEQFVVFDLLSTSYGIRSSFVSRLEMVENVTPVPNAGKSLEGIVLSRGRIIPAINLRSRFGFAKAPYDLRTRLIVVEADGRTVGLIVDAAREFIRIQRSEIKPAPEAIANLSGDYLEGIATLDGRMILILKLDEILRQADTSSAGGANQTAEQSFAAGESHPPANN